MNTKESNEKNRISKSRNKKFIYQKHIESETFIKVVALIIDFSLWALTS